MALCAAMASSGFAHRFIAADADLADYLAAGGSYADICNDFEDHSTGQNCDACRLVDSASVPPAAFACGAAVDVTTASDLPLLHLEHSVAMFDPIRAVRAPPVV